MFRMKFRSLGRYFTLLALCSCLFGPALQLASGQTAPHYDSVAIDALDPEAWNGVVFLARAFNQPAPFALRVGSASGGFLDGNEVFDAVGEVGPHAPDASYCRMAWRHNPRQALITLEWSRIDETTVVGRLTAAKDFQLVLETYFPYLGVSWGTQGFYSVNESQQAILGERYFDNVFGPTARFVVMLDRPLEGSGVFPIAGPITRKHARLRQAGVFASRASPRGCGRTGVHDRRHAAHFVATLGWDKDTLTGRAKALLVPGSIDAILKEKSQAYSAARPRPRGCSRARRKPSGTPCSGTRFMLPQTA